MRVPKITNRREFLRLTVLGASGAAILAACRGEPPMPPTPAPAPTKPAEAPKPTEAPKAAAAPAAAAKPATAKKVTLKFAHMNNWNPEWEKDLDAMSAAYSEKSQTTGVEVVKWTWSTYWATLMAAIGAGEQPDVMNVGWGEVTQLGRPHGVKINDRLTKEMKEKWIPESYRSATYPDGSIYGVPTFDQWNRGLYYRKDLLEKAGVSAPPQTWDEIMSVGLQLKSKLSNVLPLGAANQGRAIVETLAPFYYSNENYFIVAKDGKWVSTFNNDTGKEAARYFVDLFEKGVMASETLGGPNLIEGFGLGKYALYLGFPQDYPRIRREFPQVIEQTGLAKPMKKRVEANCGGAFTLNMFKQSKNRDEAWEFVTFSTTKESMEKYWLANSNMLPIRTDTASPAFSADYLKLALPHQQVELVFPQMAEWETVREKVVTPRMTTMAQGKLAFDQGMKEIQDEAQAICDKAKM